MKTAILLITSAIAACMVAVVVLTVELRDQNLEQAVKTRDEIKYVLREELLPELKELRRATCLSAALGRQQRQFSPSRQFDDALMETCGWFISRTQ